MLPGEPFWVWFNQPYMEKKFRIGQRLFVFGKATQVFGQLTFQTPEVEEITGDANLQVGRLVPRLPLDRRSEPKLCPFVGSGDRLAHY